MKAQSLDWEDPLKEEMATNPSIFVWEVPWKEEPDGPNQVHGVAKCWT